MKVNVMAVLVLCCLATAVMAEEGHKEKQTPLVQLSQEVTALQVLYALDLTRPQLEAVKKLAALTAAKPDKTAQGKGSDNLRKKLVALRDALIEAKDDEHIGDLMDDIDTLRESEKPELDDQVDITEMAVTHAPKFLQMLTARQVAAYVGSFADDIADPRQRLLESLEKVRGLPDDKWAEMRDEVSEEVSGLVAGLDDQRAAQVSAKVVQLMIVARSLKPAEFKAQRSDLEKQANQILGDIGPTDVLRHVMERALAELLSNPSLPAALEARLKKL
jgi:hypothetical protein